MGKRELVALRGAMGLSAVCDFLFSDHTHLLFLPSMEIISNINCQIFIPARSTRGR